MASGGRDNVTERDKSQGVTALAGNGRKRDSVTTPLIGGVTRVTRPDGGRRSQLDRIEASLIELLRRGTPDEATPTLIGRLPWLSGHPDFTEKRDRQLEAPASE